MRAEIVRNADQSKQTLGKLTVYDQQGRNVFSCFTMERPWLNNKRRESCIPVGTYKCIKHVSPKFGACFHVLGVVGRSEILIHKGNYYTDSLGCILPGSGLADLNKDGLQDVTNSKVTVGKLLELMPQSFYLTIK